ncbi:MAG: hypothetical protein RLO52_15120 [Sandaracinaceae bacterium]
MKRFLRLWLCAACAMALFGCGDGASDPDASTPAPDGAVRDAGGDGRDAETPTEDGGTPQPPSDWAPQPWEDCEGGGRTLSAGPDDYRDVLDTLEPGDTLRLAPGDYVRGLPLRRSGEEGRCIVIEAADAADRPRFEGSDAFNIIAVHGASWIKVRHLDVDGLGRAGFGVASQGGTDAPTHHVVIEGLTMTGLGGDQQIVGVSTKSPAWDWVIRGNRIEGAGTGLYLGNSDGNQPFIRGVIELNTVLDPIGYCMQIKHQNARPDLPGMPTGESHTIIRHNVFAKTRGASTGGSARPNLLLGHLPGGGVGADDTYLVYGNFFYDNSTEMLMQAEGNLAIYANVFVNPHGGALTVQPHNGTPRRVDVFFNTIVAEGRGLRVTGGDAGFAQRVRYNAVFGPMPLSADDEAGNVTGDSAAGMLAMPSGDPGSGLDLHPLAGMLTASVDVAELPDLPGADRDFDGRVRTEGYVGAYAGPSDASAVPLTLTARPVPE